MKLKVVVRDEISWLWSNENYLANEALEETCQLEESWCDDLGEGPYFIRTRRDDDCNELLDQTKSLRALRKLRARCGKSKKVKVAESYSYFLSNFDIFKGHCLWTLR